MWAPQSQQNPYLFFKISSPLPFSYLRKCLLDSLYSFSENPWSYPWLFSFSLQPTDNQSAKLNDSLFQTCQESDHVHHVHCGCKPPSSLTQIFAITLPLLELFSKRLSKRSLWSINQTILPSSKFFSDFLSHSASKTKDMTTARGHVYGLEITLIYSSPTSPPPDSLHSGHSSFLLFHRHP